MGSVGATQTTFKSSVSGNKITLPQWGEGRDADGTYKRSRIETEMRNEIARAEKAGYEIITQSYTTRGRDTGQLYYWDRKIIELPVKGGTSGTTITLSKGSNLGKHFADVSSKYEDVIVLPYSPVLMATYKSHKSWQTRNEASFVVMARRKK